MKDLMQFSGLDEIKIDSEDLDIVDIDIENIENSSTSEAESMVSNIESLYYDEEFMKANPALKKRIESELESLRILLKMRRSDEITHDIILGAISKNSSNASLYKALGGIQNTIISITSKINETITGLQTLLKNYQLEFNWHEDKEEEEKESPKDTHKGSKSFITQMLEEEKS